MILNTLFKHIFLIQKRKDPSHFFFQCLNTKKSRERTFKTEQEINGQLNAIENETAEIREKPKNLAP